MKPVKYSWVTSSNPPCWFRLGENYGERGLQESWNYGVKFKSLGGLRLRYDNGQMCIFKPKPMLGVEGLS